MNLFARTLSAALLAVALAGCGSNVKLDDPAATNGATATTGSTGAAGSGAAGAGAGQSSVTQVTAGTGTRDQAGPAGVGTIVYFDYDSFAIKPDYQGVVDSHARYLQSDRNRRVALEGHTDDRGSREYNLALGQKRAESVRRALTLVGVNDAQIEAVSFGKEKLAVQGSTEEAHAKNRRVEFKYR